MGRRSTLSFRAHDASDTTAAAMEARGHASLDSMPAGLRALPRVDVPLLPFGLVGIEALRKMGAHEVGAASTEPPAIPVYRGDSLDVLVDEIGRRGKGVIMTMGKGCVGKTTVAVRIATRLARGGSKVLLTTTDPAAHVEDAAQERPATQRVSRIDPAVETRRYTQDVLATAGQGLDAQGRALLEEDLRSPCTEEIAVFRAFADVVAQGEDQFVVIDTAPTGRKPSGSPEAVQRLLPRLRDPSFTYVLLVTLPEATPIHEAMQLERDLSRANITPFAWVVNQSLTPLDVTDPVLRARRSQEAPHLRELATHVGRTAIEPWHAGVFDEEAARLRVSHG